MPHGGKRPGAGKPKGYIHQKTKDKAALRQRYLERMGARIDDVMDAQYESAKGVQHMMAKDSKTGQWVDVTDPAIMKKCLDSGELFYKITPQNPNVQAIRDILDRLMDQPIKGVEMTGKDGEPLTITVNKPW